MWALFRQSLPCQYVAAAAAATAAASVGSNRPDACAHSELLRQVCDLLLLLLWMPSRVVQYCRFSYRSCCCRSETRQNLPLHPDVDVVHQDSRLSCDQEVLHLSLLLSDILLHLCFFAQVRALFRQSLPCHLVAVAAVAAAAAASAGCRSPTVLSSMLTPS